MYASGDNSDPRQRTLEMYHARIDDQNKDHILSSFSDTDGCIRVLIATIAYGMGIDCKGVRTVIHYGPPRNVEAYLQESGRAGRSAEPGCRAIVLYSNVMLQHCDDDIVEYVRNDSTCRRRVLLNHFDCDKDFVQYENPHECCDLCQKKCKCVESKTCNFTYYGACVGHPSQQETPPSQARSVSSLEVQQLSSKLDYLKKSLNNLYAEKSSSTVGKRTLLLMMM